MIIDFFKESYGPGQNSSSKVTEAKRTDFTTKMTHQNKNRDTNLFIIIIICQLLSLSNTPMSFVPLSPRPSPSVRVGHNAERKDKGVYWAVYVCRRRRGGRRREWNLLSVWADIEEQFDIFPLPTQPIHYLINIQHGSIKSLPKII